MKIGILTFAEVPNFGANLQALSTYYYFKNHGYEPILIHWSPTDFQSNLELKASQNVQMKYHLHFVAQAMKSTPLCNTAKEVADVINKFKIDAVVIGSDAVLQHHPFLERIQFPAKKIFYVNHMDSSRLFPNPFWGEFAKYLDYDIPMVIMSGSNQSSKYKYILRKTKKQMYKALERFSYISVRDEWTRKMILHITNNHISPDVTPDPVFAFNFNCGKLLKNKEEILDKYNLPKKYILFSIIRKNLVSLEWMKELKTIAYNNGYTMIALPMPDGVQFKHPFDIEIKCPLSPLDWYSLIKYSQGYIGQNMHPIVVALTNSVPVFCFDNYIQPYFYRMFANEQASKVYHILKTFEHQYNRCSIAYHREIIPSPIEVFSKLSSFDKHICKQHADSYLSSYQSMMSDIEKVINKRKE